MRNHSISLIPCLISAFLAWRTIFQLDLPFGLEDHVIQLIFLTKSIEYSLFSPIILLSSIFLRFYNLILSIKLTVALLYSLIPLSMYFLTYNLFKSRSTALISAFLTSTLTINLLSTPLKYVSEIPLFLLLPVLLISLYKLHASRSKHYIAVLIATLLLMFLSNLKICFLTSAILTLLIVYNYRKSLILLPSLILSYIFTIYYSLTNKLIIEPPNLNMLNPLIILATISTIAGMYLAFRSYRNTLPYTVIPLISVIILLPITINHLLLIPAIPLISLLSTLHRGSIQSIRVMDDVYEVNIDLDRLTPILLIAILIFSSIYNTYVFTSSYKLYSSESLRIRELSREIRDLIPIGSRVIAPLNLSVWIEALTGMDMLSIYSYDIDMNTITSTNHRLMNSYIIVDDTNPISYQYTSKVKVYDGYEYINLISVNDGEISLSISNNTINLHNSYIIDVYGNETSDFLLLTTIYKHPLLTVKKVESLSKWSPTLSITYSANTSSTLRIEIPLVVHGDFELLVEDGNIMIMTGKHTVSLMVRSSGNVDVKPLGNILNISSTSVKPLDIEIILTISSARKSQYKPWMGSLRSLLRDLNVSYIVDEKPSSFLKQLQRREIILVGNVSVKIVGSRNGIQFIQEVPESRRIETSDFIVARNVLNNSIVYDVKSKNSTLNFIILSYEVALSSLKNWIIKDNRAIYEFRDFSIEVFFSNGFHTDIVFNHKYSRLSVSVMVPLSQRDNILSIYFRGLNTDIIVREDENGQVMLYTHVGFLEMLDFKGKTNYIIYRVVYGE
ncbi:MAG: hypothetical protein QXP91_11680 [Candidatus Methanomethylicia archaeon]